LNALGSARTQSPGPEGPPMSVARAARAPAGRAAPRRSSFAGGGLVPLGAALYVLAAVQFVACIACTAYRYGPPAYDPARVTISDLQALSCGAFQGAPVCSPLHALANLSVAVLGLSMVVGSLALRPALPGGRRRDVALGLLVVAGLGAFANAFTPEDVTLTGDTVTALVAFLGANFGMIQLGRAMATEPRWRGYGTFARVLGAVGVAAVILDGLGLGTAIGEGAIEWLIVAPVLVWIPALGVRVILGRRDGGGSVRCS